MKANVDTAPMCPRVSLSSRVIVLVTTMLLTTGLGCTIVEEEHLLTPGADVHGVFEGNTLTIDIDGQHVELTSHIPMLGADPVPAYVRVDTPLGKSNYMVAVHDRHDVEEGIRELLRTWNK